MTLDIVGMIGVKANEGDPSVSIIGGGIDLDYLGRFSRVHEESGFDAALVGYSSGSADSFAVAQAAAAATNSLRFLVAHRPGFVSPTLAARRAATVDIFTGGRIGVHFITGGSDAEQRRDGDHLLHDDRYHRTNEYMTIFRRALAGDTFDYKGQYYDIENASSDVGSAQIEGLPIYFGGMSELAFQTGAQRADVYMFWGEPRASIESHIQKLNDLAATHDRKLRYSISFRPIIESTEKLAWERAHELLNSIEKGKESKKRSARPGSIGSKRLLDIAAQNEIHDERLWFALAAATGAAGNTSALVGTAEQVAESILKYYELGVETVLIRGWDPYQDAVDYGHELIPLLRHQSKKIDSVSQVSSLAR